MFAELWSWAKPALRFLSGENLRAFLAAQFLIFAASVFVAWLWPIFGQFVASTYEGLIVQMLPKEWTATVPVVNPQPLVNRAPTWMDDVYVLLFGLVIDIFLFNPAIYLLKRQVTPAVTGEDADALVIRKMRIRAVLLRFAAIGVLVLIVGLLVVGLLIFIAADRIATKQWPSAKETPPAPTQPDYSIIISTITTRVGAALMLWFLVHILVQLYRYNIKLAAFYDGRADALQLTGARNPNDLREITSLVAADRITFAEPKSPIETIMTPLAPVTNAATKLIGVDGKK